MTEPKTAPVGQPSQASGEGLSEELQSLEAQGQRESVAYDTYRKVLSEKKKRDDEVRMLSERLSALESEKKAKIEAELREKEDYKKLVEMREAELNDYKTKFQEAQEREANLVKLDAFFSKLNGKVRREYWDKIDLGRIAYDPESGAIDNSSLQVAVEEFKKNYPEIITAKSEAVNMPATAPKSAVPAKDEKKALLERIAGSGLL